MGALYLISGNEEFSVKERAMELVCRLYGEIPEDNPELEIIRGDDDTEKFTAVLDAYSNESLRIGLVPILTDVFTFARRNAGLCEALLDMRVDQRFFQRLSGLLYERCVGEWQGLYALGEIERGSYVLEFVMAGAVSLIRTWTARGFDRTPEEMARLADRLIRRGLGEIRAQG